MLWTDGERMVGSRLGRTLWYLVRDGLHTCEFCGKSHVHHDPKQSYRAVEIASEPITQESWSQVPEGTVFSVEPDLYLRFEAFGRAAVAMPPPLPAARGKA